MSTSRTISIFYVAILILAQLAHSNTKTVLITGGNRGIGFSAARQLAASNNWRVVLLCRSPEKATAAKESIKYGQENVYIERVDLEVFVHLLQGGVMNQLTA